MISVFVRTGLFYTPNGTSTRTRSRKIQQLNMKNISERLYVQHLCKKGSTGCLFSSFCARFCLYTGCYELFCIGKRIALLLLSREMGGNIFFFPFSFLAVKSVFYKPFLCGLRRKTLRGNQCIVNCFASKLLNFRWCFR